MTATYLLRQRYGVTRFEEADRPVGNAHTNSVHTADGARQRG
ncbi:hypothetical protein [Actinopolyspora erythraea]|nr:hypothetical protein [Actinopolyspora erythraea]